MARLRAVRARVWLLRFSADLFLGMKGRRSEIRNGPEFYPGSFFCQAPEKPCGQEILKKSGCRQAGCPQPSGKTMRNAGGEAERPQRLAAAGIVLAEASWVSLLVLAAGAEAGACFSGVTGAGGAT